MKHITVTDEAHRMIAEIQYVRHQRQKSRPSLTEIGTEAIQKLYEQERAEG